MDKLLWIWKILSTYNFLNRLTRDNYLRNIKNIFRVLLSSKCIYGELQIQCVWYSFLCSSALNKVVAHSNILFYIGTHYLVTAKQRRDQKRKCHSFFFFFRFPRPIHSPYWTHVLRFIPSSNAQIVSGLRWCAFDFVPSACVHMNNLNRKTCVYRRGCEWARDCIV